MKRWVGIATLLALVTGCGWTQYAGDPGRTGFAPLETTLTTANVGRATVKWRIWSTIFTTAPNATSGNAHAIATGNLLVVASNTLPIPENPSASRSKVTFFDLAGTVNCGPPATACNPLSEIDIGAPPHFYNPERRPVAGQGVIVIHDSSTRSSSSVFPDTPIGSPS